MKKGTKEFYDAQVAFENFAKHPDCPIYFGCKIERCGKDERDFYNNGKMNDVFIAFMSGYGVGRLEYMN